MPALPHQLHDAHVLVAVFLHHLGHRHLEVILCDMLPALSQRKHTSLCADSFAFCSACTIHLCCYLPQVDSAHQVHLPRMDLQDLRARFFVWIGELHLAVDSPRSQQGVIQDVDTIRCHDNLDVLSCFKTIKLVEQLQHGALHLRVTTLFSLNTRRADRVNLIHKDNGRGVLTSHNEQLTHHSAPLANVLLNQLTTRYADEATIGMMSYCPGQESLSCARRSIQQDAFRLCNAKGFKDLWVLDRKLNHLLDLLDLLVDPANHLVSAVRGLLHSHELH
mmetsp:Transcript_8153/g.18160  ORF Transcript_8153/g.18160 Transcript_8153/m.18160 type:complete len:277 (+) Transcript_8153:97-927(+)